MRERQFDALVAVASGAVPVPRGERDGAGASGHASAGEAVYDERADGEHAGHGDANDEHVGHGDANGGHAGDDHAGHADGAHADHDSGGEHAADGEWAIDFDGLCVTETTDGYRFETPETTASGLDRAGLREHADDSPYVTNWYFWEWTVRRHGRPKRAFLRRAEAADDHAPPERYAALADGTVTEWGQLRIEATLSEHGERRYAVRHVEEENAPREELTVYRDPLAARDIAETDADGRYRPLKTAPSLAGGWLFPELNWRGVTRLVDEFYPATIANWHRERRGALDVDHWRDTAERQTGIYDIVAELDRDAVDRIAASCCDDSQCLKRREWEYDDETPLTADGGTGVFPCREPCSLVVAASRKWTTLERETERGYEFTLTPSEKEQLEAILDAVADGRVGEIREADVYEGANRYRARYLREKRLDADSNLCGVPTEPDEGHGVSDADDHDGDSDSSHDASDADDHDGSDYDAENDDTTDHGHDGDRADGDDHSERDGTDDAHEDAVDRTADEE